MTKQEIEKLLLLKKSELGIYYYLLLILFTSGARISEVLELKPKQLIPLCDIIIIGKKGSSSRRITVPGCEDFILRCKRANLSPFDMISRFQVYRLLKRMGIELENGYGRNRSVTHIARKLYIRESLKSGLGIDVARDSIGHKSSKSTKYYE